MFVFASNSGDFQIDDYFLFLAPLYLILNYFLFNLFLFLQKSGGGGGGFYPTAQSLAHDSLVTCFKLEQSIWVCVQFIASWHVH